MTSKHTELPWVNNPAWQEDDGEAGAIISQQKPDEIICPEVWGQDMAQRDANAAFIVKACNMFPGLVGVLEVALLALQTRRLMLTEFPVDEQIALIEEVLVKAKEDI